jgi:hypothetical protein
LKVTVALGTTLLARAAVLLQTDFKLDEAVTLPGRMAVVL